MDELDIKGEFDIPLEAKMRLLTGELKMIFKEFDRSGWSFERDVNGILENGGLVIRTHYLEKTNYVHMWFITPKNN